MSLRYGCLIDEAFFGKKQNIWSQVPDYQTSKLCQISRILSYMAYYATKKRYMLGFCVQNTV